MRVKEVVFIYSCFVGETGIVSFHSTWFLLLIFLGLNNYTLICTANWSCYTTQFRTPTFMLSVHWIQCVNIQTIKVRLLIQDEKPLVHSVPHTHVQAGYTSTVHFWWYIGGFKPIQPYFQLAFGGFYIISLWHFISHNLLAIAPPKPQHPSNFTLPN